MESSASKYHLVLFTFSLKQHQWQAWWWTFFKMLQVSICSWKSLYKLRFSCVRSGALGCENRIFFFCNQLIGCGESIIRIMTSQPGRSVLLATSADHSTKASLNVFYCQLTVMNHERAFNFRVSYGGMSAITSRWFISISASELDDAAWKQRQTKPPAVCSTVPHALTQRGDTNLVLYLAFDVRLPVPAVVRSLVCSCNEGPLNRATATGRIITINRLK